MTDSFRDPDLLDLAQAWVDRMGAACFANDLATFEQGVSLPFTLVTARRTLVQTEAAQIREGFETFRAMLMTLRATAMLRLVESAVRISPHSLVAIYETQIVSGGQRVAEPFRSAVTLVEQDGRWRAACISNGLTNTRWPIETLHVDSAVAGPQRHD